MSKLPYFLSIGLILSTTVVKKKTLYQINWISNSLDVGAKMFHNMAVIINKQLRFFSSWFAQKIVL